MAATLAANGFRMRNTNASDQVAAVLNPNAGYREELRRKGITPKDYERANRLLVKKIQKDKREQRVKEELARREAFKLTKFKAVTPRVYEYEKSDDTVKQPRHEFLRPRSSRAPSADATDNQKHGDEAIPASPSVTPPVSSQRTPGKVRMKAPTPSLEELEARNVQLAKMTRKEPTDYVNANAWEVIRKTPRRLIDDSQNQSTVHDSFGRLPKYLIERREEWAREEEERRRNAPDPDCPPGMMLMDEDERLRTLDVLRQRLEQARRQVNALPLRIETPSQIRRKNALDAKLEEIEDAIKVFDRKKVYVAIPPAMSEEQDQQRSMVRGRVSRSRQGSVAA
ncbi:TPA: hypothetical protein N0F65_009418 [Lagenidium giganteum]|uniref:Enkurin domain-containing protein n=1 Tax=Lagenidium giganteum TaxID=4803 RepID=A0AAV2ZCQ3_9STRA|nr:TPA: hypothetical protein N0F65_009418 [Lagenidium giganteum]